MVLQEYENRKALATVTYLLLFISFTFNIFIFCYIGEILTEKVMKKIMFILMSGLRMGFIQLLIIFTV